MESSWALVPPHLWLPPSDHAAASPEAPGAPPGDRIGADREGARSAGGRRCGMDGREPDRFSALASPAGDRQSVSVNRPPAGRRLAAVVIDLALVVVAAPVLSWPSV